MSTRLLLVAGLLLAPLTAPRPMAPIEPIGAIIDAFNKYPVVALGEGPHGNFPGHQFRLALIRDPRFAQTVNDIVFECGAGQHQDLLDRWVVKGEDIPRDQVLHIWRDTTTPTSACDRPIYEEFYRAVRDVNLKLPVERRIRVLAGGAPIDWSKIANRFDYLRALNLKQEPYEARVVKNEVFAKHRKALMIFGDGHYQGRDVNDPKVMINRISGPPEHRNLFIVTTLVGFDLTPVQADANTWKAPKLALIRGTAFGAKPFAWIYSPPPVAGWEGVTMEQSFDALLYLTQPKDMKRATLPASLCADKEYVKMRTGRLKMSPPIVRQQLVDGFVKECESALRGEGKSPALEGALRLDYLQ